MSSDSVFHEKRIELLKELGRIVEEYIEDEEIKEKLRPHIRDSKVKYILHELSLHRTTKPFTDKDKDLIVEIFFYCGG